MWAIPFTTRMTIVELKSNALWVHSPIQPDEKLHEAIGSLGDVKYFVAPNRIHSLGIEAWKHRYPSAEVWVSPQFRGRHPGIHVDSVIGGDRQMPWHDEIETLCFEGSNYLDEVVFFHKRSGTLILTDLIQRHDPDGESWFWRAMKGAAGVLGSSGGVARDLRSTFHDRDAARASAESLLDWHFDRVVISHGTCITNDARSAVKQAFQWMLNPSPAGGRGWSSRP